MKDDWLKALNPGDEVAVDEAGFTRGKRIDRVKTITASGQIVTEHVYGSDRKIETRFNPDGRERKRLTRSSPYSDSLIELTQKVRDDIEFRKLFSDVSNVAWGKVSLDQLRRIDVILKESKACQ